MLVGQNLDWNQMLVNLKSNCKGCDGFALLFKVFHEQVSMCWPSCIFCSFCCGQVLSISTPHVLLPLGGLKTRHGSIKSSFPAGSWRNCFSPSCPRIYAHVATSILIPQEGCQTSCKQYRDERPLWAQDFCRFRENEQPGSPTDPSWAIANCMKFSKRKCQILHLGWDKPGYMYKLGNKRLENSTM